MKSLSKIKIFFVAGSIACSGCGGSNFDFKESKNGDIIRTDKKTGEVAVIRNGQVLISSEDVAKLSTKSFSAKVPPLGNATFTVTVRPPDTSGTVHGLVTLSPRTAELILGEAKSRSSKQSSGFTLALTDSRGIALSSIHLAFATSLGNAGTRIVSENGTVTSYSWDIKEQMDAATFSSLQELNVRWYGFD